MKSKWWAKMRYDTRLSIQCTPCLSAATFCCTVVVASHLKDVKHLSVLYAALKAQQRTGEERKNSKDSGWREEEEVSGKINLVLDGRKWSPLALPSTKSTSYFVYFKSTCHLKTQMSCRVQLWHKPKLHENHERWLGFDLLETSDVQRFKCSVLFTSLSVLEQRPEWQNTPQK